MLPTELLFAKIQPFAIAFAVGLFIGTERERSHPVGYQPLGLRTFILFSLLGAIAARINEPLVALAITLFVSAVVIAGYLRSALQKHRHPDIGITTEVAAVVTFGIGYLANSEPFIALIMGVVVLVVLLARRRLHKFSRTLLKPAELQAITTILVIAIAILPFLPNHPIDPWLLFNPQRFGILVLVIAILQFSAYIGIRLFGSTKGILLSGFLAGFVSSTAATATLAQQAKKGVTHPLAAACAVILAIVAMFIQLLIVIFVASPTLLYIVSLPIMTVILVMSGVAVYISKSTTLSDHYPIPENPLSLWSAIKLAGFLALMLIIVTLTQRYIGTAGTQVVIFLGGLVEVHGVNLALATLHHEHQISALQALNSMGIAIFASFISKFIIIWSIERKTFSLYCSLLMAGMFSLFCLSWAIVVLLLTT